MLEEIPINRIARIKGIDINFQEVDERCFAMLSGSQSYACPKSKKWLFNFIDVETTEKILVAKTNPLKLCAVMSTYLSYSFFNFSMERSEYCLFWKRYCDAHLLWKSNWLKEGF